MNDRRYALARRLGRRLGLHVVRADYYSPIPDVAALPAAVWETPAPMPGVAWDLDAQLAWVRDELDLLAFTAPPGYGPNAFFGPVDGELLDAVLRWSRPRRVLELGSGYSTLLIAAALDDGAEHHVVDPFPSPVLAGARRAPRVSACSTADAPAGWFTELAAGDVLFADTTHTVKLGGDVNRLVLELLPRLAPGVIVHLHDVFRPFPYPRALYEQYGVYWQEQELVQALLTDTDRWRILAGSHALWRQREAEIAALVPAARPGIAPSSLWLLRA